MKILQVVTMPQRRGGEIFAGELNDWLEEEGHDVYTLYLHQYIKPDALRVQSRSTCVITEEGSRWEQIPGINVTVAHALFSLLQSFQPDIVQANGDRALKYCLLARLWRRDQFHLVYRCIGSPDQWSTSPWKRETLARASKLISAVVSVSESVKKELHKIILAHSNSRVILSASDIRKIENTCAIDRDLLDTPRTTTVLIFIGALSPEKDPVLALEVLSKLLRQGKDCYLWILGDGILLKDCLSKSRELDIYNRVRFVGKVTDVGRYIKSADLHILTSRTEGLPACVIETASVGVPCIASNVGGLEEVIAHGQTGFLVSGDCDEFVQQITLVLEDLELYEKISSQCKCSSKKFTLQTIGPEYLQLYGDLLGTKNGRECSIDVDN